VADRTITTDLIGNDRMTPALTSAGRSADKLDGQTRRMGAGFGKFGRALEKDVGVRVDKVGGGLTLLSQFIGGPLGAALTAGAFAFDTLSTILGIVSVANIKAAATWVAHKAAMVATAVATKMVAAGQWLLNAALAANPIGIVIIAIVALVAVLVIAYKRSATFRAIVQGAMHGAAAAIRFLGNAAQAVFGWIKNNWRTLVAVLAGPLGIAVRLVLRHWDAIRAGTVAKVSALLSFVRGIPGRIKSALGNLGGLLRGAGGAIIDGLINGIRAGFARVQSTLSSLTSLLPSWKGPPAVDRRILHRSGELVLQGFGEGLQSGFAGVRADLGGLTSTLATATPGAGAAGGLVVQVNIPLGFVGSPRELASAIRKALASDSVRTHGAMA